MEQKEINELLDRFLDKEYGIKGTPKRDEWEKGFEEYSKKHGIALAQPRQNNKMQTNNLPIN